MQFVVSSVTLAGAVAAVGRAPSFVARCSLVGAGHRRRSSLIAAASPTRCASWVDRRFFREAYDADAILSDLASEVRTMVETRPLLETVARRIAEALHVPRVAILLNDGGTLSAGVRARLSQRRRTSRSPHRAPRSGRLRREPHARVRFDDAESWVHDG